MHTHTHVHIFTHMHMYGEKKTKPRYGCEDHRGLGKNDQRHVSKLTETGHELREPCKERNLYNTEGSRKARKGRKVLCVGFYS